MPFTRRCGLVADQCDRAASDRYPGASKGELRAALDAAPLGTGRVGLLGVYGSLEAHKGHKMEAKGFLVREAGGDRINVAALEMVAAGCAQ